MSLAQLLLAGAVIGLVMAVPVGPVNLLAISRSLRYGFLAGFVAGLGGMVADTLLAAIAAYGVTWVIDFVEGNARPIQFAGGVLLLVMGFAAMRSHPHLDRAEAIATSGGVLRGGVSAFFMTMTNPGAALAMLALFGSLGDIDADGLQGTRAAAVVAGVAAGSTLWWFVLASIVRHVRGRLGDAWLHAVNRTAGIVLVAFGAGLIASLALGIDLF